MRQAEQLEQLARPVERYLTELELEIKQKIGVVPEDALADAREFLDRDYRALCACEPSLTDQDIFDHFVESFGAPSAVAQAYESASNSGTQRGGYAPGWRISCTKCGRSAPASKAGIVRIGARSHHKYLVGYCRDCRWLRWLRLERDLQQNNLTRALGIAASPEEVRRRRHKPWLILAMIAAMVIAPFSAFSWFRQAIPWAVQKQAATAKDETFSKLPDGWSIDKQVIVPKSSLRAFSQKLGGEIETLSNTFVREGGRSVQINKIQCAGEQDVDRVYQSLRLLKRDPRSIVRRGNTIFEFVIKDRQQALFAAQARYRLPIQPEQMTYHIHFKAVPIASVRSGDATRWNRIFNLFLALDRAPENKSKVTSQLAELTAGLRFSQSLELKRTGQGEGETAWSFRPKPTSSKLSQSGASIRLGFAELPTKASLPVIDVSGKVTSSTWAKTPKLAEESPASLLSATEYWPVDDTQIAKLAAEIAGSGPPEIEKVHALLRWFIDESNMRIAGETGSRYGVLQVLEQRFGNCWDYADLFITLSRACGIPARQILGWMVPGEGHVWCEVFADGRWRQVDPTTGVGCGSDYVPLMISSDGSVSLVYASNVEITPIAASPLGE